jgi:hypothetical protein
MKKFKDKAKEKSKRNEKFFCAIPFIVFIPVK